MKPLERLAKNLRFIRNRAGVTQEKFSEAIGFEFRFYQRLEDAERESLQFSTVSRLADALELEVWELLAPAIATRKPKMPKGLKLNKTIRKGRG